MSTGARQILGPDGIPVRLEEQSFGPRPREGEVVVSESSAFRRMLNTDNPDQLLASRNKEEDFYRDMMRDPYLAQAVDGKVMAAVMQDDWQVQPGGESEQHQAQSDFIVHNLDNTDEPFSNMLFHLGQGGIIEGWSLSEIVLCAPTNVGEFGRFATLQNLKLKDPSEFRLDLDEFRNITGIRYKHAFGIGQSRPIPKDKMLIYSHLKKFSDPYGQSEMRRAYRAFFLKDNLLKFWALLAERFGIPMPVGSYEAGKVKAEQIADFERIMREWSSEKGIALPPGFSVNMLQSNPQGAGSFFEKFVTHLNEEMLIGIMGSFLSVKDSEKTGSRAAGEVHERRHNLFVSYIRKTIQHLINWQLIPRLIDWNFGVPSDRVYPTFSFLKPKSMPTADELKAYKEFTNGGMTIGLKFLRERHGIPEPEEGEEILQKGAPPPSPFRGGPPAAREGEQELLADEPFKPARFSRNLNDMEELANLETVAQDLATLQNNAALSLDKVLGFWQELAIKNASEVIEGRDIRKGSNLIPDFAVNRYANVMTNILQVTAAVGALHAQREIDAKGFQPDAALEEIVKLATPQDVIDFIRDARRIPNTTIKEAFEDQTIMTSGEFKRLTDQQRRKAFTVAGQTKAVIERDIRPLMTEAITQGWTIERFRREAAQVFAKVKSLTRGQHAETVIRTNAIGALNDGRRQLFDSAGDFVPALQYSSVIDDRTTAFCQRWDGFVARREDGIWNVITPPNHMNCRAIVIAVTAPEFQQTKATKLTTAEKRRRLQSTESGVQPQSGFGTISESIPRT